MSDWSMHELEDFVRENFHWSDDHMVPRPNGEQVDHLAPCDTHKKPRHDVESAVERIPSNNGFNGCTSNYDRQKNEEFASLMNEKPSIECSWSLASKNLLLVSCEPKVVHEVNTFTLQETKTPVNCVNNPNIEMDEKEFCSDIPISMNMSNGDVNTLPNFLLDSCSPPDANLNFRETLQQERECSNLLDDEWPDMDNFEDVDRMFRTCDSTFGQGISGTTYETSWLSSSSHPVDEFEDAFKLGFHSSFSGLNASNSSSTTTNNLFPGNDMPINAYNNLSSLGYQPYANCLDTNADIGEIYAPKKQAVQKLPKTQCQYDGKRKDLQNTQFFDGHQKQFWSSGATRQLHPCNQHVELDHQTVGKFLDSPSASKEKPDYRRHRPKLRDKSTAGNPSEQFVCDSAIKYQASARLKLDISQNDNEMGEKSFQVPGFEFDSTVTQESSCMTSVSADSRGLASFWQLQNVIDQLDIRTKLCIRDGLYRLAKSAEHRHNFDSSNHEGKKNSLGRIRGMEESKSGGFLHVETGTNSIDRSIAHLLFDRASEASRSPDDAMSL